MTPNAPVPHVTRPRPGRVRSWVGRKIEGLAALLALPFGVPALAAVALATRLHFPTGGTLAQPAPGSPGTTGPAKGDGGGKPVQQRPNPFNRAAREVVEGAFGDRTTQLVAGTTVQVSDVEIPAFGWLRGVLVRVDATGGAGGGANVAKAEDAPWNVLQDLTLNDVNGRTIVGPLSGFDLYLANKWGGYAWELEPRNSPLFSDVVEGAGASGNFTFMLRIPVEISSRDGLGALPNGNSSSQYRINYTIAAPATVYATVPATTLPTVRVRFYMEAWSPVEAADLRGRPNELTPPAPGTTQHWVKATPQVGAGDRRIPITRVGNMLRTLVLVLRTAAGVGTTADYPDALRLEWDSKNLFVASRDIQRHYMRERSGNAAILDNGVLVLDFSHDLDGRIGNEMRDGWLATTQATRLEVVGTWGANANSLQVLTNDVAPTGNPFVE